MGKGDRCRTCQGQTLQLSEASAILLQSSSASQKLQTFESFFLDEIFCRIFSLCKHGPCLLANCGSHSMALPLAFGPTLHLQQPFFRSASSVRCSMVSISDGRWLMGSDDCQSCRPLSAGEHIAPLDRNTRQGRQNPKSKRQKTTKKARKLFGASEISRRNC